VIDHQGHEAALLKMVLDSRIENDVKGQLGGPFTRGGGGQEYAQALDQMGFLIDTIKDNRNPVKTRKDQPVLPREASIRRLPKRGGCFICRENLIT